MKTTITLQFVTQAWINDYAIEADPQGPTTWEVPLSELREEYSCQAFWEDEHEKRDQMRYHANAPQWIKDWPGPFEVEFEDAFADPWEPAAV